MNDLLPLALVARDDHEARQVLADAIIERRWAPLEALQAMHPGLALWPRYAWWTSSDGPPPAITAGHWFRIVSGEIRDKVSREKWPEVVLELLTAAAKDQK